MKCVICVTYQHPCECFTVMCFIGAYSHTNLCGWKHGKVPRFCFVHVTILQQLSVLQLVRDELHLMEVYPTNREAMWDATLKKFCIAA